MLYAKHFYRCLLLLASTLHTKPSPYRVEATHSHASAHQHRPPTYITRYILFGRRYRRMHVFSVFSCIRARCSNLFFAQFCFPMPFTVMMWRILHFYTFTLVTHTHTFTLFFFFSRNQHSTRPIITYLKCVHQYHCVTCTASVHRHLKLPLPQANAPLPATTTPQNQKMPKS